MKKIDFDIAEAMNGIDIGKVMEAAVKIQTYLNDHADLMEEGLTYGISWKDEKPYVSVLVDGTHHDEGSIKVLEKKVPDRIEDYDVFYTTIKGGFFPRCGSEGESCRRGSGGCCGGGGCSDEEDCGSGCDGC